ncbi:MAG TPA: cyanophycinase [Planctomycetaceae bacterium]|nr:cyanophycinase [Planctomycetaceae bacterium]
MLCYRIAVVAWMLLTPFLACADEGTLILHGGGVVSAEVRDRFFDLAGGPQAKIVVIPTADPDTPEDDARLQTWRARGPASVTLLHAASHEQAERDRFAEPLQQATGVWISGGRQTILAATYLGTPVERELSALLRRGGVIAGTSAGAAIQSRVMIVRGEAREGFDLLANGVVDQHFLARNRQERLLNVLTAHPQRFGIGIDENTAAIVRGERLSVMGESIVTVCIAAHGDQPQRLERLKAGETLDLKPIRAAIADRPRSPKE